MVDHMLARCEWAARLGADDIAEARGVERELHGADVRLQAHHVYEVAYERSKRNSCKPNTGVVAVNLVDSTSCKHAQRASLHLRTRQIAAWLCNRTQLCFQGRAKLLAAMQYATFGKARGRSSTCAHSRPTSSPRWCMHTSAHTLRRLQSSLSSM